MNKKREWVKNAAIIFLAVMLILTFFSNTIMNYSLPEVSAQYVNSGNLSEQIRGSGTVEANQTYDIKIDETRTIASVEVKVGQDVKKGQTLYKLEDSESAELEDAEKELRAAKKAYDEALLSAGFDYSSYELDIASKEKNLASLKEDLSNISVYQDDYEKAKEKTDEIEKEIKDYEKQSKDLENETKQYDDIIAAIAAEDYSSLDAENYNKIKNAQTKLDDAEKDKTESEEKIKEYESDIASGGNADSILAARQEVENKQLEINKTLTAIAEYTYGENTETSLSDLQSTLAQQQLDLKYLQERYNNELSKSSSYDVNKRKLDTEKTNLGLHQDKYDRVKKSFDELIASINRDAKNKKSEISDKIDDINNKIDDAKSRLEDAQAEEEEAKSKASVSVEEQEKKISDAEFELEKARIDLSQKKEEDAITASKNELAISDLQASVTDAEKKVEKYKSKSTGAEITAKVGGKVTALAFSAGEEATMDSVVASIEMTEKGYTLEMTVTAEQARKVQVGDEAEVQYFWYGDAKAVLDSITPDKANPAQNKILKFSITGDVTPGQNIQLALGTKGQQYDYIVPNSSIREDTNGKFVLVVTAKSSPLGNRYIAERVDVDVLASDDTKSAVSGGFLGGEFIISTSTKPIEPGMQVRLVDE